MLILYDLIPLFIALSALYSFLKLSMLITRKDEQEQKDYEEYVSKNSGAKKFLSLLMFIIFMIIFVRGVL